MKTWMVVTLPLILLGGLVWGAYNLSHIEAAGPQCKQGTCPLEIHAEDSGKTFSYGKDVTVTVLFDAAKNPPQYLACAPEGVIGEITSTYTEDTAYMARFTTVANGTCILKDDSFTATIIVR